MDQQICTASLSCCTLSQALCELAKILKWHLVLSTLCYHRKNGFQQMALQFQFFSQCCSAWSPDHCGTTHDVIASVVNENKPLKVDRFEVFGVHASRTSTSSSGFNFWDTKDETLSTQHSALSTQGSAVRGQLQKETANQEAGYVGPLGPQLYLRHTSVANSVYIRKPLSRDLTTIMTFERGHTTFRLTLLPLVITHTRSS
jgi:hypothetical protein